MSTIVLRSVKGSPLSNAEVDSNFTNLNTDKTELGGTYSAGTANGVLFLSSSKVLTTGSALTFDGSQLGVNVAAPYGGTYATIHAFTAGGSSLRLDRTGAGTSTIQSVETGVAYRDLTLDAANHIFSISNTEQMRLTNTGLLVGLSSALANGKLQVAGSIGLSGNTQIRQAGNGDGNSLQVLATQFVAGSLNSTSYGYTGGGLVASVSAADSEVLLDAGRATSTDGRVKVINTTSGNTALSVEKNGVYALYASTTGNVGVGTSSPGAKLDVSANAGDMAYLRSVGVLANNKRLTFATGGDRIILDAADNSTGAAAALVFATGGTERMRLDSSGNLGIGTSSPGAKLDVSSTVDGDTVRISFPSAATGTTGGGLQFRAFTNSANLVEQGRVQVICTDGSATYGGAMRFMTANGGSLSEKMRLDSSGNLLIAATSSVDATYKLQVGSDTSSVSTSILSVTDTAMVFRGTPNAVGWEHAKVLGGRDATINTYASFLAFYTEGKESGTTDTSTEKMRITSAGNVGIGTSSPSGRLTVLRNLTGATDYTTEQVSVFNSASGAAGNQATIGFHLNNANWGPATTYARISAVSENGTTGATALAFGTATDGSLATPAERMRLDSSGNLGLGVTPSAWGSNTKALQIARGSWSGSLVSALTSDEICLVRNSYFDGSNWKYVASASNATLYQQASNGQHIWSIAPSGTAGDAISFTQAMTLDASGNLALGGTSASSGARADIRGANSNNLTDLDAQVLTLIDTTSYAAGVGAGVAFGYRFNAGGSVIQRGAVIKVVKENGTDGNYASALVFATAPNGASTVERARITSGGDLLVGKTSYGSIAGTGCQLGAAGSALFTASNDSPLYLGRTTSDGKITDFYRDNTSVGNISVTTSATAYNTSSDYRLKNAIAPMTGALARVAALKPCTYKWNADGSDGEGFIAHELAEVVPQCVTGEKDAVDAEGKPQYQGIDTSFLVATLTAALQELNAKFDAYVATHP